MNCCGKKRAEWKMQQASSSMINKNTNENESSQVKENSPKLFEYTGEESKMVRGAITGISYYFKTKGEKINVAYEDSFAMMGENDVKISKV